MFVLSCDDYAYIDSIGQRFQTLSKDIQEQVSQALTKIKFTINRKRIEES